MAGKHTVRAEIEEQRCLIEQQQVEILRQRHQLEMQRRHVAHLEAELESVRITFQQSGLTIQPATTLPGNGNGHHGSRLSAPIGVRTTI